VPKNFSTSWTSVFLMCAQWIAEEPFSSAPWLLLFSLPVMCLRAETGGGAKSQGGLAKRLNAFQNGGWPELWDTAMHEGRANSMREATRYATAAAAAADRSPAELHTTEKEMATRRGIKLATEGSSAAALSAMEGLGMAPPTEETFAKLVDLHPDDPAGDAPIPKELRRQGKEWAREVEIEEDDVLTATISAPKRKSEDVFGWRMEYILPLLSHPKALAALVTLFNVIGTGKLPDAAAAAFRLGRLVALAKPDPGGVRPIGIPLVFRRICGRIFNMQNKDEPRHACVGLLGRVVQFAIGRASGPQSMTISIQELMVRNPQWILISLDIRNAFNCLSRLIMAKGIADSPLRNSFSYFDMCYSTAGELKYHAAGKVYTILSKTGPTQGTTEGMQYFCLGHHQLTCEAAKDYEDVMILSDADDSNILGPADQAIECLTALNRLFTAHGLNLKKAAILFGTDTASQGHSHDALIQSAEAIIGVGKVTMADSGIITGAANAYPGGVRMVGTPIGSVEFAKEFVEGIIDGHAERLSNVRAIGRVSPQAALLCIHRSCIPRLNYLMQIVPYCLAKEAYDRGRDEIVRAWRDCCGITDEDMTGFDVEELIALPFKFGGQGLLPFNTIGNAATVGCMAAVLSDIRDNVHGLADLGDPGTHILRWGCLDKVMDELAAAGEHVAAVLPAMIDMTMEPFPRLQGNLIKALSQTAFEELRDGPVHPSDTAINKAARNATLLSRTMEGAMAWHWTPPFKKSLTLSPDQTTRKTRTELNMKQPGISIGYGGNSLNLMTAVDCGKVVGHKALNTASTGLGGYYSTHNAVLRCLIAFTTMCGLRHTTQLCGALGSNGSESDTVADLLITGLDNSNNGLMIDVSVTHPVSGNGRAKMQAALVTGHAAGQALKKKAKRYGPLCDLAHMESTWFVMETTGGLSQPSVDCLRRLARYHAENIDISRLSARDTPKALEGRCYNQWVQALSIAVARTVADRLRGAAQEALTSFTIPRRNAVALLPHH